MALPELAATDTAPMIVSPATSASSVTVMSANPERKIAKIEKIEFKKIFEAMLKILSESITLGGDSMSDYRNLSGGKGKFQLYHQAYGQTGEKCRRKDCKGIIQRKIINSRSAHFCDIHQS